MRRAIRLAATAVSLAWFVVPLCAEADFVPSGTIAGPVTAVCQIGDLTTTLSSPSFFVNANGVCTGSSGPSPLTLVAQASNIGPVGPCAAIAGAGAGQLGLGSSEYYGTFVIAEPGPAGTAVLTMTSPLNVTGNMTSVFELALSPGSLSACLSGPSSSVTYTGTAVIAVT